MKNSDLFLLPSKSEGFGMVVIEAQAAGLYCLASDKVPRLTDCGLCEYLDIDKHDAAKKWAHRVSECLEQSHGIVNESKICLFDTAYTVNQLEKLYN